MISEDRYYYSWKDVSSFFTRSQNILILEKGMQDYEFKNSDSNVLKSIIHMVRRLIPQIYRHTQRLPLMLDNSYCRSYKQHYISSELRKAPKSTHF